VDKETMSIINEIVLILILILINALLAMSEAALVASRKVRLQQQANDGNKSSELALKLLKDPNIFLSTVQIGITLIGVLAGAVGGATISEALALALQKIPYLGEFSESISLAIVVLTITILTHLSRRYSEREVRQEARAVFANTHVARDLDNYQITREGVVRVKKEEGIVRG